MSKTTLGLIGVLGVWITGGIGFPLSKFVAFSIAQIMVFRGLMTLAIPLAQSGRKVLRPSRATIGAALSLAICSQLTFMAYRAWTVSGAMVAYTSGILINVLIARMYGRTLHREVYLGCATVILGIVGTLQPWETAGFSAYGLYLALGSAIAGALFLELINVSEDETPIQLFWIGTMMFAVGLVLAGRTLLPVLQDPQSLATLIGLGLFLGYLNLLSGTTAGKYLLPEVTTVLFRGETVIAIIVSGLIFGGKEALSLVQYEWVALTLWGVTRLARWLAKENQKK